MPWRVPHAASAILPWIGAEGLQFQFLPEILPRLLHPSHFASSPTTTFVRISFLQILLERNPAPFARPAPDADEPAPPKETKIINQEEESKKKDKHTYTPQRNCGCHHGIVTDRLGIINAAAWLTCTKIESKVDGLSWMNEN